MQTSPYCIYIYIGFNQITYKSSYDDSKKYIKEIIKDKWQNIWIKQSTKLNEIKRNTCRWQNPKIKRKEKTVLNRLRIRHTKITREILMVREDAPISVELISLSSTSSPTAWNIFKIGLNLVYHITLTPHSDLFTSKI